jgi:hypothetical protein
MPDLSSLQVVHFPKAKGFDEAQQAQTVTLVMWQHFVPGSFQFQRVRLEMHCLPMLVLALGYRMEEMRGHRKMLGLERMEEMRP